MEGHLDFGEHNVHINGAKALAKQLCISAQFTELCAIQILNWHPHSKAGKRDEDLTK